MNSSNLLDQCKSWSTIALPISCNMLHYHILVITCQEPTKQTAVSNMCVIGVFIVQISLFRCLFNINPYLSLCPDCVVQGTHENNENFQITVVKSWAKVCIRIIALHPEGL